MVEDVGEDRDTYPGGGYCRGCWGGQGYIPRRRIL